MNAFDPAIFAEGAPCLPCCTTPTDCMCALLIPIAVSGPGTYVVTPCPDYSTASALTSSIQVADCMSYCEWDGVAVFTGFGAGFGLNTLSLTVEGNPDNAPTCQAHVWASLAALSGSTITVTVGADGGLLGASSSLWKCDGTFVDNQSGATQNFAVPDDGEYIIVCSIISTVPGFGGGTDTLSADITCDDTIWVNPVVALWDDSGTTRKLWACPKLILPPRTEDTADWYVDCAAAAAVMADPDQVSNCVGYLEPNSAPVDTFTANDGGTSLTLDVLMTAAVNTISAWGGINAVAGETLTVAITSDAGVPNLGFSIYDDTGTLVEVIAGASGPFTSSPLPYTGRYSIVFSAQDLTAFPGIIILTTANFVITSSGAISVNPIQARYDIGLTCPATLDCGDACP